MEENDSFSRFNPYVGTRKKRLYTSSAHFVYIYIVQIITMLYSRPTFIIFLHITIQHLKVPH
jgi:hypothetical protein